MIAICAWAFIKGIIWAMKPVKKWNVVAFFLSDSPGESREQKDFESRVAKTLENTTSAINFVMDHPVVLSGRRSGFYTCTVGVALDSVFVDLVITDRPVSSYPPSVQGVFKEALRSDTLLYSVDEIPAGLIEEMGKVWLVDVKQPLAEVISDDVPRWHKMLRGRKEGAAAGRHQSGPAPYGYKRDHEKRLVLAPKEAEVVKLIFSLYLKKKSMKRTMEYLNAYGHKTRRRKEWSRAGISWILKNTTYTGRVHFGDVRSKGIHKAIVSPIIFNKVQKLIRNNDKRSGKKSPGDDS